MKKALIITITIIIALIVLGGIAKNRKTQTGRTPAPPSQFDTAVVSVPDRFQNIYDELEGRLTKFDAYLNSSWNGRKSKITFATELIPANGNRGEGLLKENSFQGSIIYLDKLESLGIEGVTIQMPYPILIDGFPRSEEYWAFYKKLAQEIKRRGLKLLAKSGPVFTEKEISPLGVDYSQITLDEYFDGRKKIAKRIASEIQPDYLTIGNEPSTEMMVLGKRGISEERYVRFINETLQEIDRSRTLIGAGSGNWDNTNYIESFSKNTTLDYIDLHIYPLASVNADYLMRAAEMADIAKRYNKKVVIGEMWFYKAAARELTAVPTHLEMFGRDTFGFWAPLDQKMLEVITKLSHFKGIEYVSPFWSKYFFAYLDYEANKFKSPGELLRQADVEAVKNILANKFTQTALFYKELIEENK